MEESGAATQGEAGNNTCVRDSAENQTNGAAGGVSSQASEPGPGRKPTEEPGARFNRLKLFDKVMQKSLEKLIEHARYTQPFGTF